MAKKKVSSEQIDENQRVEDILLGSLGYGEDARIVSIRHTSFGYEGVGKFSDGELFDFQSEEELDELQVWALKIACAHYQAAATSDKK